MKLLHVIIILAVLGLATGVAAHGGEQQDSEEIPLTLPQIFAITVAAALLILLGLYQLGITDKSFLAKMFVAALILLTLDFIYVRNYA